jgi:hypothetical protein
VSQAGDGIVTIDLPGPVLDPEADADRVYELLTEAMEAVRQAMVATRNDLAKALRGRFLVPRTDASTDGCARQEGELTKLATKVGALADLRSPARVGNPMYLACPKTRESANGFVAALWPVPGRSGRTSTPRRRAVLACSGLVGNHRVEPRPEDGRNRIHPTTLTPAEVAAASTPVGLGYASR